MAKYVQPNQTKCQHCGTYFSMEEWYADVSYMDRGNVRAPRLRIVPNCSCPYPIPRDHPNIEPATRKETTVTEKQFSTDAIKNEKLKAVSNAFQSVEAQLLSNAAALEDMAVSNAKMLTAEVQALDRNLLKAGQAGVTFDELTEAFPADSSVLTNRLEAVWEIVKLANVLEAV